MVSRVLAATPPSVPEDGEGRMKALGSAASRAMRVLSPRIEPPVRVEDGSTASTATLWPCAGQIAAERVDDGGLAGAGRAGDAEPHRLAGQRQQLLHQPMRLAAVVGALALDQRDGARQHGALAGADAGGEGGDRLGGSREAGADMPSVYTERAGSARPRRAAQAVGLPAALASFTLRGARRRGNR